LGDGREAQGHSGSGLQIGVTVRKVRGHTA